MTDIEKMILSYDDEISENFKKIAFKLKSVASPEDYSEIINYAYLYRKKKITQKRALFEMLITENSILKKYGHTKKK